MSARWAVVLDVERSLLAALSRLPGWAVAIVALLLYPGIGLVLPFGLHWSRLGLIEANVCGVVWAAAIGMGWLTVKILARDRRHLVEWTTDLRLLNADEFEWLVGEVFRRSGFEVQETGRSDGPDGNVDLVLRRNGQRTIVQCKRWTSHPVGVDQIRAFAGTLMRERLPAMAGIFITLSFFTSAAEAEARATGLTVIDGVALYSMVEKVRRQEPCPVPSCKAPMVLDRSARGWWFRCTVRGCSGKRDLAAEPARAVELLTKAA